MTDNLARAPTEIAEAPISMVRGVVEAMPFGDSTFDLVWVCDVLVDVEPLVGALRECRRVLRTAHRCWCSRFGTGRAIARLDADRQGAGAARQ